MSVSLVLAAAFLVYVAVPYFGNKALIVRSGSMQPAIGVGDLVVVNARKPVAAPAPAIFPKYKIGDIVAFSGQKDTSTITTHRIVDIKAEEGKIQYVTKGDANDSPDSGLVSEDKILGKSAFKIAGLGKIFALAKTRDGFLALVIVPALLVILFEIYNILRELIRIKREKHGYPYKYVKSSPQNYYLRMVVPIVVGAMFFQESFASYADTEVSAGNLIQAAVSFTSSPSPSPSSSPQVSAGDVVINEIMWMGTQGDAADEWIELRNMTGNTIDLSNWVVDNLGSGVTNDIVIPAGKSISPNGFFMIANDTVETGNHNVSPDHVTNISLLNPSEQLRLRISTGGTIIDAADNDGDGWFAGVDPGGQNPERSMERNDTPGDGTVAPNWHTATSAVNMDPGEREIATPKSANSTP